MELKDIIFEIHTEFLHNIHFSSTFSRLLILAGIMTRVLRLEENKYLMTVERDLRGFIGRAGDFFKRGSEEKPGKKKDG